jgi:hypothetical protein
VIQLDVGTPGRVGRLVGASFCVVLALLGVVVCGYVTGMALATDSPWWAALMFAVAMVLFAGVLVLSVALTLAVVRYAAHLDGTTLVVRGVGAERRVDLATALVSTAHPANVWFSLNPPGGGAGPQLHAAPADDQPGNRPVVLWLLSPSRDWLPAEQLTALADAIASGDRSEEDEAAASRVADALREVAADPTKKRLSEPPAVTG